MSCIKYSTDLDSKFLIVRHGQTSYNIYIDKHLRDIDSKIADAPLNETGIKQAKSRQKEVNKLNIKYVYCSPLFRALQTASILLENHPEKDNIVITVHPLIHEALICPYTFPLDISYSKSVFNLNSKVKVDWDLFDEITQKLPYQQNFFYFSNITLLSDQEKVTFYDKFNESYKSNNMEKLKEEMEKLSKYSVDECKKPLESLRHVALRFDDFRRFLLGKFGGCLEKTEEKVLIVCHGTLIQVLTAPKPYENDDIICHQKEGFRADNCQIISIYL